MNKPSQSYSCSYCSKTYTRKIYYERHVICCNLRAMADVGDYRTLEEQNDTPCLLYTSPSPRDLG